MRERIPAAAWSVLEWKSKQCGKNVVYGVLVRPTTDAEPPALAELLPVEQRLVARAGGGDIASATGDLDRAIEQYVSAVERPVEQSVQSKQPAVESGAVKEGAADDDAAVEAVGAELASDEQEDRPSTSSCIACLPLPQLLSTARGGRRGGKRS
ncbi:unnamed protein product [Vitrella brassicaformis CCMP3155]|uniref:Uncharacterized protein n=1 Tax=Vitrella brassicaformis (strain CCMP3155) TaxID=1169540 RepID=A0A0G4ETV4_VITBC|nr:unnamed protein product [Vitrella brassicaformis CCMP3155]|eukprot:CEM01493.1 unnamed protein product [Vitrella brassicaformis CCMP3155]